MSTLEEPYLMVSPPITHGQFVQALEPRVRRAKWLVVVGIDEQDLLAVASACAGPVLVVLPDQSSLEQLHEQWLECIPPNVQLKVQLLGSHCGEHAWFYYNDARLDGTIPIEQLQITRPNLRVERVELREQTTLGHLLAGWQPARDDGGMLLIAGPLGSLLQSAGDHLQKVACLFWIPHPKAASSVLVKEDSELTALPELDKCCKASWLMRDLDDVHHAACLAWHRDETLRFKATVVAERDQLLSKCDRLQKELASREEQLGQISQDLDKIIDLIE